MVLESQQLVVIIIVVKNRFNVRYMFDQSYFALPVHHNTLHYFFAYTFYHFTCLPILEGDIIRITNHDYDEYLSISELGNQVDHVMKDKYKITRNNKRE